MREEWRPSSAARDWVMSELLAGAQRRYMARLLPDWIQQDAAAAKAYLEALPSARARAFVIDESVRGKWHQQDKVKEWAKQNLDAETQDLTRTLNPETP